MPGFFFFQAEDGIRDGHVTGVQTCALPIYAVGLGGVPDAWSRIAVARGFARTLQDAAHPLRRFARRIRGRRLDVLQAGLVAVAAQPDRNGDLSARDRKSVV